MLSDHKYLQKEGGAFAYPAFFWNIVAFFKDLELKAEAQETLGWWNR